MFGQLGDAAVVRE